MEMSNKPLAMIVGATMSAVMRVFKHGTRERTDTKLTIDQF